MTPKHKAIKAACNKAFEQYKAEGGSGWDAAIDKACRNATQRAYDAAFIAGLGFAAELCSMCHAKTRVADKIRSAILRQIDTMQARRAR